VVLGTVFPMNNGKHSEHVRAAVMASLLQGKTPGEITARCNVSKAYVSRVKKSISLELLKQVETNRGPRLEEMVFACLEGNLKAQLAITNAIGDATWIRKNTAADLAVLYERLGDKEARILELVTQQEDAGDTPADPGSSAP